MSADPKRKQGGRPYSFRLSSDELAKVSPKAEAAGLSVGEFARRAALGVNVDQQQDIRGAVARLLQAVEIAANRDADLQLREQLKDAAKEGLRHLMRTRP